MAFTQITNYHVSDAEQVYGIAISIPSKVLLILALYETLPWVVSS